VVLRRKRGEEITIAYFNAHVTDMLNIFKAREGEKESMREKKDRKWKRKEREERGEREREKESMRERGEREPTLQKKP